jgi:hypothetical protein
MAKRLYERLGSAFEERRGGNSQFTWRRLSGTLRGV